MDDLDRLVSSEAIRQLVARYAHAIDGRDLDALVGLYVDDVSVGGGRQGRDALREAFDNALREVGVTILNIGTHVIDFQDADHAGGHLYCKAEVQMGERWIHQAIRYDDHYERRADIWYILSRNHQLWYGADVGTNPLGLEPANWPERNWGAGTLPFDQPTWQTFWSEDD